MTESAVPRPTVSQKASVSKMRLLFLNRRSLGSQLFSHRSMIPAARSAFARLGIAAPEGWAAGVGCTSSIRWAPLMNPTNEGGHGDITCVLGEAPFPMQGIPDR